MKLPSYSLLILMLRFILLLVLSYRTKAMVKMPPNVSVPAVIAFGDSIVDPGNNNKVKTLVKCNFPPYGKDFEGGIPTGRFCNGKIPTDLLGTLSLFSFEGCQGFLCFSEWLAFTISAFYAYLWQNL